MRANAPQMNRMLYVMVNIDPTTIPANTQGAEEPST